MGHFTFGHPGWAVAHKKVTSSATLSSMWELQVEIYF
jgi:hypothetical protein